MARLGRDRGKGVPLRLRAKGAARREGWRQGCAARPGALQRAGYSPDGAARKADAGGGRAAEGSGPEPGGPLSGGRRRASERASGRSSAARASAMPPPSSPECASPPCRRFQPVWTGCLPAGRRLLGCSEAAGREPRGHSPARLPKAGGLGQAGRTRQGGRRASAARQVKGRRERSGGEGRKGASLPACLPPSRSLPPGVPGNRGRRRGMEPGAAFPRTMSCKETRPAAGKRGRRLTGRREASESPA